MSDPNQNQPQPQGQGQPTGQQVPPHLQGSVLPQPPATNYVPQSLQGLSPEQLQGLEVFRRQLDYATQQSRGAGRNEIEKLIVEQTGLPMEQVLDVVRRAKEAEAGQQTELQRKMAEIDERERKAKEREEAARRTIEDMTKVSALVDMGLSQAQAQAATGMLNIQVPQGQELTKELAMAAAEQLRQTFPQMFPAPQMVIDPTTGQPVPVQQVQIDPQTGQPIVPQGQQPILQPGQQLPTPGQPLPPGTPLPPGVPVYGQPAPAPAPFSTYAPVVQPGGAGAQGVSAADKAKARLAERHGTRTPQAG